MLPRSIEIWITYYNCFFLKIDLMQSGIKRFSDQSPPPITLPALAVEMPKILF